MFKPMLAPNDQPNLEVVKYPLMASYKLDGIRCLITKEGEILSRSLKQIQNKQLREKLEPIRAWCEKTGNTLDGEIYNPNLPFQAISSCVMTQDFEDKKAIKKWEDIKVDFQLDLSREEALDGLKFYCFDALFGGRTDWEFYSRIKMAYEVSEMFPDIMTPVNHINVDSEMDIQSYFKDALKNDYEGLILRDPFGRYKCGRGTIKEGLIYKVKPFVTLDAEIIGVGQATKVDPNADKKINELGRSVTSKKKGDRILVEKACEFHVMYEGNLVKPVLAMTDEQKEEIWANKEAYIGKTIEYKGMLIGAKDVPRHPVMVRFREDKDHDTN